MRAGFDWLGYALAASLIAGCNAAETEIHYLGESSFCYTEARISDELTPFLHDFKETYIQTGAQDLPLEWLSKIHRFDLLPENELIKEGLRDKVNIPDGATIMGYNKTFHCRDGIRYKILFPDPLTMKIDPHSSRMMQNSEIFASLVFHEIAHVYYRHYQDNESLGWREAGFMAAKCDDKPADVQPGLAKARLIQLFTDQEYKDFLPRKF